MHRCGLAAAAAHSRGTHSTNRPVLPSRSTRTPVTVGRLLLITTTLALCCLFSEKSVIAHLLHRQPPLVFCACVLSESASAAPGNPTTEAHIRGSRSHGLRSATTALHTLHKSSSQRESPSLFSSPGKYPGEPRSFQRSEWARSVGMRLVYRGLHSSAQIRDTTQPAGLSLGKDSVPRYTDLPHPQPSKRLGRFPANPVPGLWD